MCVDFSFCTLQQTMQSKTHAINWLSCDTTTPLKRHVHHVLLPINYLSPSFLYAHSHRTPMIKRTRQANLYRNRKASTGKQTSSRVCGQAEESDNSWSNGKAPDCFCLPMLLLLLLPVLLVCVSPIKPRMTNWNVDFGPFHASLR